MQDVEESRTELGDGNIINRVIPEMPDLEGELGKVSATPNDELIILHNPCLYLGRA